MADGNQNHDWESRLSGFGSLKTIAAGAPILFQGEKATMLGFILSGRAQASVFSEQGTETWVGWFLKGEFFGHTSLLSDAPIKFEVKAETDMKILVIPAHKFDNLLTSNDVLSTALTRNLAERLNTMTSRLVEAVTLSSKGRVCAELLRLARPIGIDPGKFVIRPIPVFTEMGLRISTSRETVSRTVSDLQKDKILTREPGAILIHKFNLLQTRFK